MAENLKLLVPQIEPSIMEESAALAARYTQDPISLQLEMEEMINQSLKSAESLIVNSGTAAIQLALKCIEVEVGDYVLCPSFTFAATVNAIKSVGAEPVFIGVEPLSWNMDQETCKHVIESMAEKGKLPKAILFVHGYGVPGDILSILEIANSFGIPVIEDAAGALGSRINGQQVGTFGQFGVISTNYNKVITTFGGGILLMKNPSDRPIAYSFSIQGRHSKLNYDHVRIGFNYQSSVFSIALLMLQWKDLPFVLEQKSNIAKAYRFYFREWSKGGLSVKWPSVFDPLNKQKMSSNHWLNVFTFEDKGVKNLLIERLKSNGILSRALWKPMHTLDIFSDHQSFTDGYDQHLFDTGFALPSSSFLEESHLNKIFEVMDSVKNEFVS